MALLVAPGGTASGQTVGDVQIFALAAIARDVLAAGGVGVAVRPGGRLRFAVNGVVGSESGAAAGRVEAVAVFHLNPFRQTGWAAYGGGGAAVRFRQPGTSGFLLVMLGAESRPARRLGWFVEVGAGGGVRLATGLRVRTRRSDRSVRP